MSPKIVDKEKRREEILEAAFDIFRSKGYHSAKLSDIAKAAGMGQGTLYYYFPTKEEIFWGVYESIMNQAEALMSEQMHAFQTPRERLFVLLRGILTSFPEVRPSWLKEEDAPRWQALSGFSKVMMEFWLQAERGGRKEDFYERISAQQRWAAEMLAKTFEEASVQLPGGFSYKTVAFLLLAMRDGLGFQLRMGSLPRESEFLEGLFQGIMGFFGEESEAECRVEDWEEDKS